MARGYYSTYWLQATLQSTRTKTAHTDTKPDIQISGMV